jgi:hypothetical protein
MLVDVAEELKVQRRIAKCKSIWDPVSRHDELLLFVLECEDNALFDCQALAQIKSRTCLSRIVQSAPRVCTAHIEMCGGCLLLGGG